MLKTAECIVFTNQRGGTGYNTVIAENVFQGVAIAHKEKPDLIILDLGLPGGGGLSVLNRLKQSSSKRNIPIPVIVLTGMKDVDLKKKVLEAGVSDYLEKPYDPKVLLESIEKFI